MDGAEPPANAQVLELVQALEGLRDALVNASLSLKDIQFVVDPQRRGRIEQDCHLLLEKMKAG